MAHIYMTFDFGTDEERAQQARHKLEMWKQAFRLDKKMLYRFERSRQDGAGDGGAAPAGETGGKPAKTGKTRKPAAGSKGKGAEREDRAGGTVRLHLRLAFSGHEKMTEEGWLKRIPSEAPFNEAAGETVKSGDPRFLDVESKFDSLE
jgi:hypothetical protein